MTYEYSITTLPVAVQQIIAPAAVANPQHQAVHALAAWMQNGYRSADVAMHVNMVSDSKQRVAILAVMSSYTLSISTTVRDTFINAIDDIAIRTSLQQLVAYSDFVVPSLYLDFTTGALDPRITFSRADASPAATRVNSAGLIETVPVNLEVQNSITTTAGMTGPTTDSTLAPDGSGVSAKIWTAPSSIASAKGTIGATVTPTAGSFTYSVYVKLGTTDKSFIQLVATLFNTTDAITFDLSTGNKQAVGSATGTILQLGGGWWRLTCTLTASAVAGAWRVYVVDTLASGRGQSSTALGTFYTYGHQAELGSVATTYIPTTTAAGGAPRFDYDPVTLAPKGLLIEEARTNIIRVSDLTGLSAPSTLPTGWSVSGAGTVGLTWSIVGTGTSGGVPYFDIWIRGTSTAGGDVRVNFDTAFTTSATSTAWSISAYLALVAGAMPNSTMLTFNDALTGVIVSTKNVVNCGTLSASLTRYSGSATTSAAAINQVDGGTVRCNAGSAGAVVDWTWRIAAPQMELGSFTSYIPTTTAAVTRAADVTSMTLTNFSSWFNPTEGTFVASADTGNVNGSFPAVFSVDNNSDADRIYNFIVVGATLSGMSTRIDSTPGGGNQMNGGPGVAVSNGSAIKASLGYLVNLCGNSTSGSAVNTDNSVVLPAGLDRFRIGINRAGTISLNGHIQRLTYYNKRLPDAILKGLSAS